MTGKVTMIMTRVRKSLARIQPQVILLITAELNRIQGENLTTNIQIKITTTIMIIDQTILMTRIQNRMTIQLKKEQLIAILILRMTKTNGKNPKAAPLRINQMLHKLQILKTVETELVTNLATE